MTNPSSMAVEAFARADLLLLAAGLLSPPPRTGTVPGDGDVAALVRASNVPGGAAVAAALHAALAHVRAADADADAEAWRAEHTRLFQAGVICPVNETAYVRRDKGVIIADICGFYRAFGFESIATTGEKPDHVLCELEFMAVLLVMLGQARQRGDDEAAEITLDALGSFTRDHPAEWVPLCCGRLAETTRLPLLAASASAIEQAWNGIIAALGVEVPEPATADLPAPGEDETPYECDMAERDASPFTPITVDSPASTESSRWP